MPRNRSEAGLTLLETLFAAAIGSLLLTALASLYFFSMRSFGSMANYSDFGRRSRQASDMLTRDIRSAPSVVSATSTQIVLSTSDGTNITYSFDTTAGTLTRVKGTDRRALLKNLSWLSFVLYQRPATNATYNSFTTSDAANAKMVGIQWSCSQLLEASETNSEDIQTAIVSLRNK